MEAIVTALKPLLSHAVQLTAYLGAQISLTWRQYIIQRSHIGNCLRAYDALALRQSVSLEVVRVLFAKRAHLRQLEQLLFIMHVQHS